MSHGTRDRLTIDQQRARHAWRAVESLPVDSEEADDYAREAKKLPVRIITSGLGQALAFVNAKKAKKQGLAKLEEHLTDWAKQRLEVAFPDNKTLLDVIVHNDSDFLRRATEEMLAYLVWLNRFTEAKGLPKKGEQD
ncbi:MAG TPA: type III-B CRISPR module-associated protein Cmr5 [Thermogutta sp.]|nr:type III-B CRISPR module-associated protein Cmr5 [Thermogutta sp.]HPU06626.1 type III-B CRISPR module-associated protein Cmr5 [Thermogutta sp.]HQF12369.1 type III-B CRISPR module-associated protein Cmr5 [Thermogutta sp.]